MAVLGTIAGQAIWMANMPIMGDQLLDGLIGAALVVVSLSAVLAMGVVLFGKSKDRLLLEEIRAKQDETNHLLRIIAGDLLKDRAVLDEGGKTAAGGGGGNNKSRAPV